MKILIISDSHRDNGKIEEVINREKPFDMLFHAGDAEGAEYMLDYIAGCPVEVVMGNNDFFSTLPKEREFELCGHRFLLTHGHYYYVSMGTERIEAEARARDVDVVVFGHTHKPLVKWEDDLLLINPGSVAYPRQSGREYSYVVMNIDDNDEIDAEIKYF